MTYSVRLDSEEIFGTDNIAEWADLNNDKDEGEIAARIAVMIQQAFDEINGRLLQCKYTVPFELIDSAYDPIIVILSARLTGVLLYDSRKLVDTEDFDEVQFHRKKVMETYGEIHGGILKLLKYTPNAVDYPQAIICS